MYDTVNFRLKREVVGGVDFMEETACYIDDVAEHNFSNGETVVTGKVGGLKVNLSENQIKVCNGSLCKWYLGDNYKTMGRQDTQRAIEKLSDTLHLPMDKAVIYRLDIAQNFIVKYPIEVYCAHLGHLAHYKRLQQQNGLYYSQRGKVLCLYDKNKEYANRGETVPPMYKGRNVLRYEQRYRKPSKQFGCEVTGKKLYDEAFYMALIDGWLKTYQDIKKLNDVTLNFEAMKTKKDLYKMGVLALTLQAGGQNSMTEQINDACKRGVLSSKQAYDLRLAVNEACTTKEGLIVPNEAIQELTQKVREAMKFYR